MSGDVFAGCLRFVIEAHQDHRVERINRRHQKRSVVPVATSLAERLQFVVPPAMFFIAVPGMQKFGSDLGGERASICWALRCDERCGRKGYQRDGGESFHTVISVMIIGEVRVLWTGHLWAIS